MRKANSLSNAKNLNQWQYSLLYYDFYLQEKDLKKWQEISKLRPAIESNITIFTDIAKPVKIPVRGHFARPEISQTKELSFGMRELHSENSQSITIFNPSDQPLFVQFHIGPSNSQSYAFLQACFQKFEKSLKTKPKNECKPTPPPKSIQTFDSAAAVLEKIKGKYTAYFTHTQSFIYFSIVMSNNQEVAQPKIKIFAPNVNKYRFSQ